MIEAIAVLLVLIGGGFFVLKAGINDWGVPALAYIAGTCLLINIAFIQIISGLPSTPILTLVLTVAVPLCWWLSKGWRSSLPFRPAQIAVTLFVTISFVYVFQKSNLIGWSVDTLNYLLIGALIASDNFDAVTANLLQQRLLAFPILHAPANVAGEFYLPSVGPLLAIAGIGLFIWLSLKGLAPRRKFGPVVCTALGVLLLITNGRMVWSAFALFPHLLCAVLILLIAGAGWLIAVTSSTSENHGIHPAGLIALQSIAIPALVIARAEGGLMVAMAILPTLLCGGVALKYRVFLLCVFGASLAAWNLLLVAFLTANAELPFSILGPLAAAVIILAATSMLGLRAVRERSTVLEEHGSLILIAAEAALWTILAAAAIWKPEILLKSISATEHNLLYGAGGWGYSLITLALLVVICSVAARGSELIFLRFPVTSFIPSGFLLAYLRDGPYRIGVGDSLNRMWIHIVPLAVLFVIAAMNSDRWRASMALILPRWQKN